MGNKIQVGNLTNRGRGRPKGAQNKTTREAKEVIAQAATELGGRARLVAWAKEDEKNEAAFWTSIYPRLLPVQVHGTGDNGEIVHRLEHMVIDPLMIEQQTIDYVLSE